MVLLVDTNDVPLGTMPKMEAHREGALHRAFSVFVFNSRGEMLLQRRAAGKYHSAGLWTNTCCSHPSAEGDMADQARRRTVEEMGINPSELHPVGTLLYRSGFDNGLIENEFDHIFIGYSDEQPSPDPKEVAEYAYVPLKAVLEAVEADPESFTVWFRTIVDRLREVLEAEIGREL